MSSPTDRERVLALAVYEIRLLLAGYLGNQDEVAMDVRQAAHLAYALHNVALGAIEGDIADLTKIPGSIAAVDKMRGSQFAKTFGVTREV